MNLLEIQDIQKPRLHSFFGSHFDGKFLNISNVLNLKEWNILFRIDSISLCWFNNLCNFKLAQYIYYQCSFELFSILQPHCPSKFARVVLYPYPIPVGHLLIQIFSDIFSLVQCLCDSKFLKFITLTSSTSSFYFIF